MTDDMVSPRAGSGGRGLPPSLERELVNNCTNQSASDLSENLRNWSTQDFANIYVRFRPQLISHARRFLRDETHSEEVVQDAFLYVMTSLPELDSELGVLRFLKWKVRMLSLDVIRSRSRSMESSYIDDFDSISTSVAQVPSEPAEDLIRAEDAAVVQLALARLSERHRRALSLVHIDNLKQEEAAEILQVEPNAFRQLLLRARRSFRDALIGEMAEYPQEGRELLSVSIRKSRLAKATVAVLALVPALVGGAFFQGIQTVTLVAQDGWVSSVNFGVASSDTRITPASKSESDSLLDSETPVVKGNQELVADSGIGSRTRENRIELASPRLESSGDRANGRNDNQFESDGSENTLLSEMFAEEIDKSTWGDEWAFGVAREGGVMHEVFRAGELDAYTLRFSDGTLTLTLEIEFDTADQNNANRLKIRRSFLEGTWGQEEIVAAPSLTAVSVIKTDEKYFAAVAMTDFIVGDRSGIFQGVTTVDSKISSTLVDLRIQFDLFGNPMEESLELWVSPYISPGV